MIRLTDENGDHVFLRSFDGLRPEAGGTIILDRRGRPGMRVEETVPMILLLKKLWDDRSQFGGASEDAIVAVGFGWATKPVYLTQSLYEPNDINHEPIA